MTKAPKITAAGWRRQASTCPHCGQIMLIRCGVRLPPIKARLFDAIEGLTAGRGRADISDLVVMFFPGVPTKDARNRVRVHVNQLKDWLAATDAIIRSVGGAGKVERGAYTLTIGGKVRR